MQNIGQDIIHKIYNTETTQYQKPDYANRCVVYYDKSFFYKVFPKEYQNIDKVIKFFKNYNGSLKMIDYHHDVSVSILKFNLLAGETVASRRDNNIKTDLDIGYLKDWFINRNLEIHNAGLLCSNKHKEFQLDHHDENHQGFRFCFTDWSAGNILYNNKTLTLVDLQPIDWIPVNVWFNTIRDHYRTFLNHFDNQQQIAYENLMYLSDQVDDMANNLHQKLIPYNSA
jgi:hypothetical protein